MNEQGLREQICAVGRHLWTKNLVGATDGNISVRLDKDRFLITPSGVSKGFMKPEDILIADGRGEKTAGPGKVSSEFFTHLAAFQERPDIASVVHAHPATATALTLAGIDMTRPIVPEILMGLIAIPTAPYATPGSREGADAIRGLIREYDAIMVDRHGAFCVGESPFDAYLKLEKVEHTAMVLHAAHSLGQPRELLPAYIEKLMALHAKAGEPAPPYPTFSTEWRDT